MNWVKKLTFIIAASVLVGASAGAAGTTVLPNNHGFTSTEISLMKGQIKAVEAGGITNATVKPLGVVEVKDDRLAFFEVQGDGHCSDGNTYEYAQIGAIEHKPGEPDTVGPVHAVNATAFAGMDGQGAC